MAPALALGIKLKVLDVEDDLAVLREFARGCDVLTIYRPNVSTGLLRTLEAEGVRLRPGADALNRAQEPGAKVNAFDHEISTIVARSPHGQAAVWAPSEILSENGKFKMTLTPAPGLNSEVTSQAQRLALEMAGTINLVGVMNVSMFVVQGQVIFKQITLGPSEFGCWTIEGSITSQFEQHLRAILDLPLGATDLLAPCVVSAAVVGTDKSDLYRPYLHVFARDPFVKVHHYGKMFSPGQTLGHVTVIGSNVSDLRERAAHAADYISGVIDE